MVLTASQAAPHFWTSIPQIVEARPPRRAWLTHRDWALRRTAVRTADQGAPGARRLNDCQSTLGLPRLKVTCERDALFRRAGGPRRHARVMAWSLKTVGVMLGGARKFCIDRKMTQAALRS